MKAKRICCAVLVCALLMATFAGCGLFRETSVARIQKAGEIVLITEGQFQPYEYLDADGNLVGVDIEIAKAVAKELGVQLKIEVKPFNEVLKVMERGEADFCAAGLSISDERKLYLDFSIVYANTAQLFVLPAGTDITNYTFDDKVIAVQEGSTAQEQYAENTSYIKAKRVDGYESPAKAVDAMLEGLCDLVLMDALPADVLVQSMPQELMTYDPQFPNEDYGVAVCKGDKELLAVINTVLQRMLDSGEIARLTIAHMEDEY